MSSPEGPTADDSSHACRWQLYKVLISVLQHDHTRWIDNYRVFLGFNAFLLPASTALIVYAGTNQSVAGGLLAGALGLVGIVATMSGLSFIRRVCIDAQIRVRQITRLEDQLRPMPLAPYSEGRAFFFQDSDLPGSDGTKPMLQKDFRHKGMPALHAFAVTSWTIAGVYAILAVYAVWTSVPPIMQWVCGGSCK